ncbi:MAG: hypothetical protein JW928_01530 [Candidatus Aureabacteria bacterium]|nr:hypothetical protein [Candidatus Auribacterota bacterium]
MMNQRDEEKISAVYSFINSFFTKQSGDGCNIRDAAGKQMAVHSSPERAA